MNRVTVQIAGFFPNTSEVVNEPRFVMMKKKTLLDQLTCKYLLYINIKFNDMHEFGCIRYLFIIKIHNC